MGKIINGNYVDWIERVKILQKAAIKNKEGKILALRRPLDAAPRPRPGCWDLCGGSVETEDIERWRMGSGRGDDNDILARALRREIKEEANLDVKNLRAIHCTSGTDAEKGIFVVTIGYECEARNENGLKLSAEHIEYKWATKEEFLKLEIGDDGGSIGSILQNSANF